MDSMCVSENSPTHGEAMYSVVETVRYRRRATGRRGNPGPTSGTGMTRPEQIPAPRMEVAWAFKWSHVPHKCTVQATFVD